MKILHTMIRVGDLEKSIEFYTKMLKLKLLRKMDYPQGKFTLAFLGYNNSEDEAVIELTYNWNTKEYDLGNGYGHIAIGVTDVRKLCQEIKDAGGKVTNEPWAMGSTLLAFIEDPDGYKIELVQID